MLQYFSKPWNTFFSGCRLVLSCLVMSRLAYEVLLIFNISHFFPNKHEYPLHTLHIYNIPQRRCANQLQSVLLTVTSMYGSDLFSAIKDQARREKTRQCVALRQLDKRRIRVSAAYEKHSTFWMWALWNIYLDKTKPASLKLVSHVNEYYIFSVVKRKVPSR